MQGMVNRQMSTEDLNDTSIAILTAGSSNDLLGSGGGRFDGSADFSLSIYWDESGFTNDNSRPIGEANGPLANATTAPTSNDEVSSYVSSWLSTTDGNTVTLYIAQKGWLASCVWLS